MVLKKSSFKSIFTNKLPLINNFSQSPRLHPAKPIDNDTKITDFIPKIRNVSNFYSINSRVDKFNDDITVNIDNNSPVTTEVPGLIETENVLPSDTKDIDLEKSLLDNNSLCTHYSTGESQDSSLNESISSQSDFDVFKILIATDSHLGYKDDDIYLSEDSINTFHEVLYLANKLNVDCIFHSGDLFDQNRPGRVTMYKTMELLNEYCLGIKNSTFEVLNYESAQINAMSPLLLAPNTLSDKFNVKLPIFMIHGNHDNPSHDKGLSAIDLLNISGLVNYFGKIDDFNYIKVKPLLLKKGKTKIALYGLGWIKDERLVRAFQTNKIEFLVPNNLSEWICILLFHQNRHRGNGPSAPVESCIPESYIPDFIDLIIWGHEHESQRAPVKSATKNHRILQLGSSIRTSLIQSESLPKHIALLEVKLDSYKIYPIRLETVRPLIYREISLKDYNILPQEKSVWDFLSIMVQNLLTENINNSEKVVNNNILTLSTLLNHLNIVGQKNVFDDIIKKVNSMPLVRIKIDYTGFPTINPKSFGSQFIGKIANPCEIIRFHRKRIPVVRNDSNNELVKLDVKRTDTKEIFDILYENVDETGSKLNFFSEYHLNVAVQGFVLGMDSKAISTYVNKSVDEMKSYIANKSRHYNLNDEDLCSFIQEKVLERANLLRSQVESKIKTEEFSLDRKNCDVTSCEEINLGSSLLDANGCAINKIPKIDTSANKRFIANSISDTVVKKKIAF